MTDDTNAKTKDNVFPLLTRVSFLFALGAEAPAAVHILSVFAVGVFLDSLVRGVQVFFVLGGPKRREAHHLLHQLLLGLLLLQLSLPLLLLPLLAFARILAVFFVPLVLITSMLAATATFLVPSPPALFLTGTTMFGVISTVCIAVAALLILVPTLLAASRRAT